MAPPTTFTHELALVVGLEAAAVGVRRLTAGMTTAVLGEVLALPAFVRDAAQLITGWVLHPGVDLLFVLRDAEFAGLTDASSVFNHNESIIP